MFDNYDITKNTLLENVILLIKLIELRDSNILLDYKYGEAEKTADTKEEVEVFISSLKAYINTQVSDL